MKLVSYFSVSKKILLAGAVLLCASDFSAARSILDQDSQDVLRAEIFGSSHSLQGALTFDNFTFDYATAGIGTVTFRASAKQFPSFVVDQDAPRALSSWGQSSEASSFISPNFASGSSFFVSHGFDNSFSNDGTSPDLLSPLTPVPEPSTWLAGALALAAMGFARRRSLRRLIIPGA